MKAPSEELYCKSTQRT